LLLSSAYDSAFQSFVLTKYLGGGGGHWLVWIEWCPAGWSVCLPLLIFPCTIKSKSSILAPAHLGGPGRRAIKQLWWYLSQYPVNRQHAAAIVLDYFFLITAAILRPFFRDHLGEQVPEENFWTLWCKGRLTEADTPTVRLGATPSGPISAHHHPLNFYRPDDLPAAQPTVSKH